MNKSNLQFEYKEWGEGDECVVNYGQSGVLKNCKFVRSKRSEGCTWFDVILFPFEDEPEHWSELNGIRSIYVERPEARFIGKSQIKNYNQFL